MMQVAQVLLPGLLVIASGQEYAAGVRRKALSIAHSLALLPIQQADARRQGHLARPGHAAGGLAGAHLRHPAGAHFRAGPGSFSTQRSTRTTWHVCMMR